MPFETDVDFTIGHDINKHDKTLGYTCASFKKSDHWITQKNTFDAVLKYVPKTAKIWMPFYYDGACKKILNDLGFENVIHEDKDFFTYQPDDWDMVIDNPPYSNKPKVIERLISLGKPFALVLPLNTATCKYSRKYFNNGKISLIILNNNKHHFLKPGQTEKKILSKHANPIMPCWFCFDMNLPDRIIFED